MRPNCAPAYYNLEMSELDSKANARQLFILLPSAVEPPSNMPFLALRDPSVRFKQTLKALRFWSKFQNLDGFDVNVVIGDNTGWSKRLFQSASKGYRDGSLIFVEVPRPLDEVILRGKGAAETEALIFMLNQVQIPQEAFVIKMTARQYCVNAADLLVRIPATANFAAWPRPFLDSIDSRFFIGRAAFLREVLPIIANGTDDMSGAYVENLYAQICIWDNRHGFVRLDHEPGILGQAGTTGTQLSILSESVLIGYFVAFRNLLRTKFFWIQPRYARKKSQ
jgi:hypothetical protein